MAWPPPLSARWTALALFLLALGLHLFVAIGGTVGGLDFRTLIIADEIGAILLAPVLVALILRLPLTEAFLLRSAHWSHYLVAGAAAIPLQLFGGSIQEIVIESLPDSDRWRELLEQAMEPMIRNDSLADLALLMFGGVVLAAVCEEVLFRGLLFQLLAIGGRIGTAVVVTAVLFALFHLDPIGLLPRTLMGIYFALLVWRSGSIFPAMVAHGANNLLAFAALPLADPTAPSPTLLQAALVATGSAVVFGLVLAAWLRWSPSRGSERLRRRWRPPAVDGEGISVAADEPTGTDPRPDSTHRTDRHES